MSKKIVVVTEYFYPNERTDAFLLTEIVKKIAEVNGGDIKIVCTSSLEGKKEIPSLQGKVIRLKASQLNENKIITRIVKFIILTARLSWSAFKVIQKNDRVFLTTNPAFLIPVISILRKFKKFEYTLLVYDVFPENLSAGKVLSSKSFFYKIVKKIYDWAYAQSDRLVVIGRDMEEVIQEKTAHSKPTYLIQNWCDYHKVVPQNKEENELLKRLNIEKKKVFLFAGTLGRVQGIKTLLEASKQVKDKDFILLFVGKGAYLQKLMEFIEKDTPSNVYYAGSFPISEQNTFLNACDVSIISLSDEMYGLGVPSKSYYNMAAAKPLLYIGDERSEIAQVIKEHKIGWQVEANSVDALVDKFEAICNEIENASSLGKKSRKIVETYFSKEVTLEKYSKLYRGI